MKIVNIKFRNLIILSLVPRRYNDSNGQEVICEFAEI